MNRLLLPLVFAATVLKAQNTGVNTTNPTNTLDVNGTLRVRTAEFNASPVNYLAIDNNGVVQKTTPLRVVEGKTIVANQPVNVTVPRNVEVITYSDLGLSANITVPAGKKYQIFINYSVPMGVDVDSYAPQNITITSSNITSPVSGQTGNVTYTNTSQIYPTQIGGYFGIGLYRGLLGSNNTIINNTLLEGPTRKTSIPKRAGKAVQMTTISSNYTEIIDNSAGTSSLTNVYSLRGYVEHYDESNFFDSASGTIRFNMYSVDGLNYNWGRATLSYTIYELP